MAGFQATLRITPVTDGNATFDCDSGMRDELESSFANRLVSLRDTLAS